MPTGQGHGAGPRRAAHLAPGEQQPLLKVGAAADHLGVQRLQPVHQEPRARPQPHGLQAAGRGGSATPSELPTGPATPQRRLTCCWQRPAAPRPAAPPPAAAGSSPPPRAWRPGGRRRPRRAPSTAPPGEATSPRSGPAVLWEAEAISVCLSSCGWSRWPSDHLTPERESPILCRQGPGCQPRPASSGCSLGPASG